MAENDDFSGLTDNQIASGRNAAAYYMDIIDETLDYSIRPLPLRLDDGFTNRDIIQTMAAYKRSLELAKEYSDGLPTLKLGSHRIPIDILYYLRHFSRLSGILPRFQYERYSYFSMIDFFNNANRRFYSFFFKELSRQSEIDVIPFRNATDLTYRNLSIFLGYRTAGLEYLARKQNFAARFGNNSNYYQIKLTTQHLRLQVEATPAFFLSWSYFGHPTSPLVGPLQPGWYLFGGTGPSLPSFTHDPTIIKIPPHVDINLQGI